MQKLLEILKSLKTDFEGVLVALKDGDTANAIEKSVAVVSLLKTAEDEAQAVIDTPADPAGDAPADGGDKGDAPADPVAPTEEELEKTKALQVEIAKRVNLGISADTMEGVIKDVKALMDVLGTGGINVLKEVIETCKTNSEAIEKLSKKVSISKQVGESDEGDEKPVQKSRYTFGSQLK